MTNETAPAPRLLLIDDDATLQVLITAIFHRIGIDVDMATDGRSALRRLRQTHYGAVILEVVLHTANGGDVIRDLQKGEPEILGRTIVVTTADERLLAKFSDIGRVHAVIRKPFEVDALVETVLACLGAAPEATSAG